MHLVENGNGRTRGSVDVTEERDRGRMRFGHIFSFSSMRKAFPPEPSSSRIKYSCQTHFPWGQNICVNAPLVASLAQTRRRHLMRGNPTKWGFNSVMSPVKPGYPGTGYHAFFGNFCTSPRLWTLGLVKHMKTSGRTGFPQRTRTSLCTCEKVEASGVAGAPKQRKGKEPGWLACRQKGT